MDKVSSRCRLVGGSDDCFGLFLRCLLLAQARFIRLYDPGEEVLEELSLML